MNASVRRDMGTAPAPVVPATAMDMHAPAFSNFSFGNALPADWCEGDSGDMVSEALTMLGTGRYSTDLQYNYGGFSLLG